LNDVRNTENGICKQKITKIRHFYLNEGNTYLTLKY
jgi:hypothetical protein